MEDQSSEMVRLDTPSTEDAARVELANAALQPKQEMTLRQFKTLRRMYFTVRHDRIKECGHRFDKINEPRNNCEYCWFAFFQSHGELVKVTDQAFKEGGAELLDKLRGIKYRKMFCRFMSTLAHWKMEQEKQSEQSRKIQSSGEAGSTVGEGIRVENSPTSGEQRNEQDSASNPD